MIKNCSTCERRDRRTNGWRCLVFAKNPENCWAWTDDPDWEKKVKEQVERYREGEIE